MAPQKNAPSNKVPEIRTGDTVVVLHGKDAGKRGKVERVLRNPVAERSMKSYWKRASSHPVSVVISGMMDRLLGGRLMRDPRAKKCYGGVSGR